MNDGYETTVSYMQNEIIKSLGIPKSLLEDHGHFFDFFPVCKWEKSEVESQQDLSQFPAGPG